MSRRPSSWSKLSTIVERPGQPVALIPRKRGISCVRASVLPSLKNRDTLMSLIWVAIMSEGVKVHSQSFEAEEAKSIERAEASNESNELLAVRLKASNE